MALDSNETVIASQNAPKILIQKIAVTASAARTDILAVTLAAANYGVSARTVAKNCQICIQPDVSTTIYYNVCPAGATTAVTNSAGANPGTVVSGGQQEFVRVPLSVYTGTNTTFALDIVATGTGTVSVFLAEA